jgi:Tfp pilus assembly protein PilF
LSPSPKKRRKSLPRTPPPESVHLSGDLLVKVFVGLALVMLTVLVYCPSFDYPFTHFDDDHYVTQNEHVQAGLSAAGFRWAFTTFDCGNWHPLTWLSLQLDASLYGKDKNGALNAGGFHVTNVLLHAASTLLLFLVLAWMTVRVWPSAMVAALFALHPLHVEPVAWVAERKGLLSAFFWMLTLAAYVYYVRRPSVLRYLLVALALILGLMAKPLALTLPAVLLLLDYWPLKRVAWGERQGASEEHSPAATGHWRPATLLLEKLPLVIVALGWFAIAYMAQSGVGALPSFEQYPLPVRIWNGLEAYVIYLGKTVWPIHLAPFYPHPGAAISVGWAIAAGLLLAVITALVLVPGRRWPYLAVGWLWYLITLVPMIGLVQIGGHGMADRYTYVPLIGLFLLLTWGAIDLAAAWRLPRFWLLAGAGMVLFACVATTWTQLAYWKTDGQLWEHALAVTQNNAMAHNNLGMEYFRQDRKPAAEAEFEKAVKINPKVVLFHHNLASLLRDLGRPEEAAAEFSKAIALNAEDVVLRYNLASVLRDLGRDEEALDEYHTAIKLDPNHPVPHNDFGNLLRDLGRWAEAQSEFQRASELDPAYASPHVGVGNVFADQGQREEAIAEYRRAVELNPKGAVLHNNLALALQTDGRLGEAQTEFRKAADLGYPQAAARLKTCALLQTLRSRLPGLIAGTDKPTDNLERLAFAELSGLPFEARYALAARLYTEAFDADSSLTRDPSMGTLTEAARTAARAGCGEGQDASGLSEDEKARLRAQALNWLQTELAHWRALERISQPQAWIAAHQALLAWQRDTAFAGVRKPAALAKLPEAEREAWRKLWQDVEQVWSQVRGSDSRMVTP